MPVPVVSQRRKNNCPPRHQPRHLLVRTLPTSPPHSFACCWMTTLRGSNFLAPSLHPPFLPQQHSSNFDPRSTLIFFGELGLKKLKNNKYRNKNTLAPQHFFVFSLPVLQALNELTGDNQSTLLKFLSSPLYF